MKRIILLFAFLGHILATTAQSPVSNDIREAMNNYDYEAALQLMEKTLFEYAGVSSSKENQEKEMKRENIIDLTTNSDEEIEEIDLVLLYYKYSLE